MCVCVRVVLVKWASIVVALLFFQEDHFGIMYSTLDASRMVL
jgi:hypothetical protein